MLKRDCQTDSECLLDHNYPQIFHTHPHFSQILSLQKIKKIKNQNNIFETCTCILSELLLKGNILTLKSTLSVKKISTKAGSEDVHNLGQITLQITPIRGIYLSSEDYTNQGHAISGSSVDLRFILTDLTARGKLRQEPSSLQDTSTVTRDQYS